LRAPILVLMAPVFVLMAPVFVLMAPGFVRSKVVPGEGEVEARREEGGCACGVGGEGLGFRPAAG